MGASAAYSISQQHFLYLSWKAHCNIPQQHIRCQRCVYMDWDCSLCNSQSHLDQRFPVCFCHPAHKKMQVYNLKHILMYEMLYRNGQQSPTVQTAIKCSHPALFMKSKETHSVLPSGIHLLVLHELYMAICLKSFTFRIIRVLFMQFNFPLQPFTTKLHDSEEVLVKKLL